MPLFLDKECDQLLYCFVGISVQQKRGAMRKVQCPTCKGSGHKGVFTDALQLQKANICWQCGGPGAVDEPEPADLLTEEWLPHYGGHPVDIKDIDRQPLKKLATKQRKRITTHLRNVWEGHQLTAVVIHRGKRSRMPSVTLWLSTSPGASRHEEAVKDEQLHQQYRQAA